MRHTPSLKLAPLCLALTSCTGLCAPTGTYELFPEDMGTNTPDLRMQDMRGGKDAKMERDLKEMSTLDLGRLDQGGKDLGDMCIPTTTSDDEDWLCDGIDNDCDGVKDEACCMNGQRNVRSVGENKSTGAILKIESLTKNINNQFASDLQWQIQYKNQNEDIPKQLFINTIGKATPQREVNNCENTQFINKAKKPNIKPEEAQTYLYTCFNTLKRIKAENLEDDTLYIEDGLNNKYIPFEIAPAPNLVRPDHIYTTPTDNEKLIWMTFLFYGQNGISNNEFASCLTDITLTKDQFRQRENTCIITQSHTVDNNNTHINSTNYSPSKYHIHYMYDSDKISYTSPDASATPPPLNINTSTAPAIITDKTKANEDKLIIVTDRSPQNGKNTLNLYTVNFGQEVTQAPIELLPRNNLNQWPAMTEIDRDGVKGAEQVALVWQQDKRLMLAIFDPYNPGTISPKTITREHPTATNIISSIASDDKGLGVAWTAEGEDPQKIYYQAISFNGDFICPAADSN